MEINSSNLISQYYDKIKASHPTLTPEQIETICKHPFQYTASRMATKDYDVIRLKGLGKFMVYETRIIKAMKALRNSFNRQVITRTTYLYRISQYQAVLSQITPNEGITIIDDTPNPTPPITLKNNYTSNLTKERPDNAIRNNPTTNNPQQQQ